MGLGKTISALALMVSRPSSDRIKTNLIVGPIALLKQWEIEIKKVTLSKNLVSVHLPCAPSSFLSHTLFFQSQLLFSLILLFSF